MVIINKCQKSFLSSPRILGLILFLSMSGVHAEVVDIDTNQLQDLIDQGVTVIDVRTEDEWTQTGIIEDSIPLTFFDQYGAFDSANWFTQLVAKVDQGKPVALICHAGVRSQWVANWMDENSGFDTLYNVTDGMAGWITQGMAVTKPD